MNLKIKNVRLSQFKGVLDASYEMGGRTSIHGANGTGKTTIATAIMWLFFDRDYSLAANPNVRPIEAEEAIPTVTLMMDVDGKEVSVSKSQKLTRSKDGAKVSLTNTYKVNEVPKTERDFKSYLEDLGFNFDNALACMHPSFFLSQTAKGGKAMRDVLFQMAQGRTDLEIASMDGETADLAELLNQGYKLDEIEAMNKATAKKAAKESESIPEQIVGMEKTKVEYNEAELLDERDELVRQIMSLDEQIASGSNAAEKDRLSQEKFELQFEINERKRQIREAWNKEREALEALHDQAAEAWEKARKSLRDAQDRADNLEIEIPAAQKNLDAVAETYISVANSAFNESEWDFDESQTYCKYCGQKLPDKDVEKRKADFLQRKKAAKKDFDEKKAKSMESIEAQGFAARDTMLELTAEKKKLDAEIPRLTQESNELFQKKNKLHEKLDALKEEPDFSQDEKLIGLSAKSKDLALRIIDLEKETPDASKCLEQKEAAETALKEVEGKLAQLSRNAEIDAMILQMRSKQRDAEQAKADAEKILNQLDILGRKKNEMLTEEINSHFGLVKWELFTYQKNGGYKECCVPMVDGYRFGESTNTGREILAKLDICDSLQKFFHMGLPIVADGMESLDFDKVPKVEAQLVELRVTNDPKMKVEKEG